VLVVSVFLLGLVSGREGRLFRELWTGEAKMTRERQAIATLKEIALAEARFREGAGNGTYGSLAELVSAGLLGNDLSKGEREGYSYSVGVSPKNPQFTWAATATPDARRGARSFVANQSGCIFDSLDGPLSVDLDYCVLPLSAPWKWPVPGTGGKSSCMRLVRRSPAEAVSLGTGELRVSVRAPV